MSLDPHSLEPSHFRWSFADGVATITLDRPEKKNPLTVDSKEPTVDYKDFLMGEVRYRSLQQADPEKAERLFDEASENAKNRYDALIRQRNSLEK